MVRNNLNYIDLGVGNVNNSRQLRTINLHAEFIASSSHNGPFILNIRKYMEYFKTAENKQKEKLDFWKHANKRGNPNGYFMLFKFPRYLQDLALLQTGVNDGNYFTE